MSCSGGYGPLLLPSSAATTLPFACSLPGFRPTSGTGLSLGDCLPPCLVVVEAGCPMPPPSADQGDLPPPASVRQAVLTVPQTQLLHWSAVPSG